MSAHPWRDLPLPPADAGLAYPADAESFDVEELPLYEPVGEGEHLFVFVEKRDIDTPALARLIAERLGLDARGVGWAGRKDRHATARQWLSLPRPVDESALAALAAADGRFRVLAACPHGNKLRLGHLRGNRFRLLLRGETDPAAATARLAALRDAGMPNYFGPQRFGRGGDNHERGRALLAGGRRRRRGRADVFLQSAFQSALFNAVCAARRDGPALLAGDLAWIHAKGAVFRVEDLAAERPRAACLEISATGPLPGRKMMAPMAEAGELEAGVLAESGWEEAFAGALRGGRRPLRVPLPAARLREHPEGLLLELELPAGSYASVCLALLGVRAEAGAEREE